MYRTSIRRCVTILLLVMPAVASAIGMGNLTVRSALGQPFAAEIDLVAVHKDEASSLSSRLASPAAYKEGNLQYGPALSAMRVGLQKRPDGSYYISLSSSRPVNELFVNLLVELNWNAGHIVRAYTALIDPPGFAPVQSSISAPANAAQTRPMTRRPPIAEAALASEKSGGEYGPVKRGETLSKIARSNKPEGVSVEQMLVGLYRSNPEAFIHNNMNLLKAGSKLQMPDRETLTKLTASEAAREVRLQTSNWRQYRRKLSDMAGLAPEGQHKAPGKPPGRVEDKAAPEGTKDVLRLSPGVSPGRAKEPKNGRQTDRVRVLEEELIAREKALKEANDRIKELETAVKNSAGKAGVAK